MSLLLEALKKAEKAKEEAQKRARGDSGGAAGELRLEGDAAPEADNSRVVTRPELPDISQPLEILSDDLAGKEPPLAGEKKSPDYPVAPEADPRSADRASARKVFEAKFKEPNPRMPFYIAMGVLGVFALGTVGYFWYQLRTPYALVNANPPRPAGEALGAAAAETTAPIRPAAAPTGHGPIPRLPGAAALPSPTPAPTPAAASSPTETLAGPQPPAQPPPSAPPARPNPRSPPPRPE